MAAAVVVAALLLLVVVVNGPAAATAGAAASIVVVDVAGVTAGSIGDCAAAGLASVFPAFLNSKVAAAFVG